MFTSEICVINRDLGITRFIIGCGEPIADECLKVAGVLLSSDKDHTLVNTLLPFASEIVEIVKRDDGSRPLFDAGWRFTFNVSSMEIFASHPLGGSHPIVTLHDVARNGFDAKSLGVSLEQWLNANL